MGSSTTPTQLIPALNLGPILGAIYLGGMGAAMYVLITY